MKKFLFVIITIAIIGNFGFNNPDCEITVKPIPGTLMTDSIQNAIDHCANAGGGTVRFSRGTYLCGTIELKSNVTLFFDKGAVLQGSDKYSDYRNDAFIFGKDLRNISIRGEGIIDGVDCYNPHGEEGFRGPHCLRLINCDKINFSGFTIQRSANWAINCRYCKNGTVDNVKIRGGHDGLHTRFCENFTVNGCDVRTGDDCFAGNDNQNFVITNCLANTSCSGFRFGCLNLRIEHCKIWGPGEYMHRIRKVRRMPTAFVHFSPDDENARLPSANWVVRDLEVDSVQHFYVYNHVNGLWQTGQPAYNITFENVKAKNIQNAFYIIDKNRKFSISLLNSSFSFLEGTEYKPAHFEDVPFRSYDFFYAENFASVSIKKVTFEKGGQAKVFTCNGGDVLQLEDVNFKSSGNKNPYKLENIKQQSVSSVLVNGIN